MNKKIYLCAGIAALVAPMPGQYALAQVEDIVVTAQKREEKLQDVPLAISAFASGSIEKNNVTEAQDIAKLVPALSMTLGNGVVVPFLRGVGNPAVGQGNEASTAMYIDGIYYQRLAPAYFQLNNIERIEVLKGPQGTLFGRNAVGGVVHIITRDPGQDPDLRVSAGYGNYDTFTGNFYGSTPISENVAMDLAVLYSHQGDGWGRNVTTGAEYNWDRTFSARSKLVLKPGDHTSIKLTGDYVKMKSTIGIPGTGYRGTTQGNELPPTQLYLPESIGFYDVRADFNSRSGGEHWGVSANIDQEMGFADFVSLTSFRKGKDTFIFDGDYTPQNSFVADLATDRQQFSQEFQLKSKQGSSFDWLIGLYHLDLNSKHDPGTFSGPRLGGNTVIFFGQQKVHSNAAFGQATFHLGSATNLTAGLRYTRDRVKKRGQSNTLQANGNLVIGPRIADARTFSKLTYKLSLDHHFNDDVMAYASYSRGFKAGTYRITPVIVDAPARPEVLDAYELGMKSELFDRRLRLNGAIFYYKIKDPQVVRYVGTAVRYINAQSAEVKGIDIDGQIAASDDLSIQFGATFLRGKYKSFTGAPFIDANPNPPYGNGQPYSADASGNWMSRSPKVSLNVGFSYDLATSMGNFNLASNYYYNDGFYWDPDNRLKQKPYSLIDATLTYRPSEESQWSLKLWGKNLAGEKYYLQENEIAGPNGSASIPAAPRTYGATLTFEL